jgi:hypothetical protein
MRPLIESRMPRLFERAHHGAGDRQRDAEHQAGAQAPPPPLCQPDAHRGRDGDLQDRPGQRDAAHIHQVLDREMQADPEHQQHHADFCQLARQRGIGHETGRGRADQHAGGEVAHQRGQAQLQCQHAEQQPETERCGESRDQREVVVHRPNSPPGKDNCSVK